jgi:hypothetical protein
MARLGRAGLGKARFPMGMVVVPRLVARHGPARRGAARPGQAGQGVQWAIFSTVVQCERRTQWQTEDSLKKIQKLLNDSRN